MVVRWGYLYNYGDVGASLDGLVMLAIFHCWVQTVQYDACRCL